MTTATSTTTTTTAIAIASNFGVGANVGMTGVGRGLLMTPLRLTVFKLNRAVAIGTDAWFAAITKIAGSVSHDRLGHVNRRITALLLANSIPAVLPATAAMHFTGIIKGWASALTFSLGIALLITAVAVVGTDIAHAVPWTQVAGIGHATLGPADWALLGAFLVGSFPGIWLGTQLTRKLPKKLIRNLLCASLVTARLKAIV